MMEATERPVRHCRCQMGDKDSPGGYASSRRADHAEKGAADTRISGGNAGGDEGGAAAAGAEIPQER